MGITLTHSTVKEFGKCPRSYYYRNVANMVPKSTKAPLMFGSVFHNALEDIYTHGDLDQALDQVRLQLGSIDQSFFDQKDQDKLEWSRVVLIAAVYAWYQKFYLTDINNPGFQIVDLERKYRNLPIVNPKTGRVSKLAKWAFTSDMLIRLDGDLWMVEYKTASQMGQTYIERLELCSQVSGYVDNIQRIYKEPVKGIIYRILKKPSIKIKKNETQSSFLDRLTKMFEEESADRLIEYRFRRSKEELDDYKQDQWEETQQILAAHKKGMFPRNTNSCVMYGKCSYFSLCKRQEGAERFFKQAEDRYENATDLSVKGE